MPAEDDWRLHGQEKYLKGLVWTWKTYAAPSASWDHDHCAFCWAKFMQAGPLDTLHEGYATSDNRHWVCKACFDDFKTRFAWTLGSG